MFGRPRAPVDRDYERSQTAPLPFRPGAVARGLTLSLLNGPEDPDERRRLGQLLLDQLSADAGFQSCELVVADRPQVHAHDGRRLQRKTYGYYRCWFEGTRVARARIRIYHRTAVRQQVISPKVFLNTLLHEWAHHLDFAGMRMRRSPHTRGFYARLRSLAEALEVTFVLPPEPEVSISA